MTRLAVIVVEIDAPDDAPDQALANTARCISDNTQGLPIRRVWAGINETAEAVAGCFAGDPPT